jgi:hypothetical protein
VAVWPDLSLCPGGATAMTGLLAFLLFAILLCLCRPLRTALGAMFWIVALLLA